MIICRFQWPRGLRCRSAAARLLRSWVQIPPGAWMFVCYECCVLSGRGLCDELITGPEKSYRPWCVVVCDLEKPHEWGGHSPHWAAAPQGQKNYDHLMPPLKIYRLRHMLYLLVSGADPGSVSTAKHGRTNPLLCWFVMSHESRVTSADNLWSH